MHYVATFGSESYKAGFRSVIISQKNSIKSFIVMLRRSFRTTRRVFGAKPDAKRTLDMPDLSHPKWARREKLNPMNFANKGKSGFRYFLRVNNGHLKIL
jgi:hypothetical protein